MTYEIYNYIFIGAAIASGILLVVSVVLFFTLKIPKVISDLSGRTEREGVENIRKHNEATGDKSYKSSSVNLKRGKLTDKISKSGRIMPSPSGAFSTGASTEKIATRGMRQQPAPAQSVPAADVTTVLQDENQTVVLGAADATTVLRDENQTVVLNTPAADATTLLAAEQTTLLADTEGTVLLYNPDPQTAPAVPQNVFEVEIEITYIHTNVMIG